MFLIRKLFARRDALIILKVLVKIETSILRTGYPGLERNDVDLCPTAWEWLGRGLTWVSLQKPGAWQQDQRLCEN